MSSLTYLSTAMLFRPDLVLLPFLPNTHVSTTSQAAGIKVGDTLQKLGGVPLGSYKDGIEMFKKQRGDVVLTILRQIGAS